jgi:cyclopropane fatty-acyl-phospholipid synthase-like methyltransferase
MSIFFEIHQDNPREGPGDNASTRRAYEMLQDLPPEPQILDIGCGPGMQTLELARISGGRITAVDNYWPFLDRLKQNAKEAGLEDRIRIINQSMFSLELTEKFDVVWSEGAIYIMGFRKGLREWKEYLKPQGYIAVSELTWLKPNPPLIVRQFWGRNYPAMTTIDDNLKTIQESGYNEIGHFVLPESAWWANYYDPVLSRVSMLRARYAGNPEFLQELDAEQAEISLYRKYHDFYGYVFYVMRSVE